MPRWMSKLLLCLSNLLIPIAILAFASGFFPYKPFLPGLAQYEDLEFQNPPEAPFNKLVFMVVDALRRYHKFHRDVFHCADFHSDFVYSEQSGFRFTQRFVMYSC